MTAYVVHQGATVLCFHGANAMLSPGQHPVKVSGHRVATSRDDGTVTGCPFTVSSKAQPCTTIRWVTAATRVKVNGQPVLLDTSSSTCYSAEQLAQGTASIPSTQRRVKAT